MVAGKVVRNRRRWGRYPFQRPVSLCLCDRDGRELWRLGWIRNVGGGGMKIRLNGNTVLRRHQEVVVLLQGGDHIVAGQTRDEVHGRIAWIDDRRNSFGLRFA